MPMTCTICRHPEREAIDKALVSGEPIPDVSVEEVESEVARMRAEAGSKPYV